MSSRSKSGSSPSASPGRPSWPAVRSTPWRAVSPRAGRSPSRSRSGSAMAGGPRSTTSTAMSTWTCTAGTGWPWPGPPTRRSSRRAATPGAGAPPSAQPNTDALVVADELTRRFGLPLWRFANSGTEATMDAVHLMRAVTGRDLIIKVEGCYHGHHDSVQVSVSPEADEVGPASKPAQAPASTGIPDAIIQLTLIASFNDLDSVARLLDEHPGGVAGMIIEPIMMNAGIIHPEPGYLAALKDLLHAHGALLTFDEVKTGLTAGP